MDAAQVFSHLNWLAILLAALTGFPIGGVWYGPLFGRAWMTASGVARGTGEQNPVKLYGTVLVLNLIIATSLAMFIGPNGNWQAGLFAGFMAGFTFVAMALGVTYLFESRPLKLWLINAGYQVILFTVMGVILGAWH
ncbi:MAG TPA: DUF1761 domain-containing protein [Steroidobacteraceae bacterium]|jgi:hypothetical protein|nr:DUF1761 domain-containing protein [Steroidobacteraceae bacterium]